MCVCVCVFVFVCVCVCVCVGVCGCVCVCVCWANDFTIENGRVCYIHTGTTAPYPKKYLVKQNNVKTTSSRTALHLVL